MTFERIEAMVRAAQGRGLAMLEFSEGDAALRVVFGQAPIGQDQPGQGEAHPAEVETSRKAPLDQAPRKEEPSGIASPCVGLFRLRHPVGAVVPAPGETVEAGAVVAFVQAGPLLHPVASPRAGTLGEALVADGAAVAFGTPLLALS